MTEPGRRRGVELDARIAEGSRQERVGAIHTVVRNSRDVDDAHVLLSALGLNPREAATGD